MIVTQEFKNAAIIQIRAANKELAELKVQIEDTIKKRDILADLIDLKLTGKPAPQPPAKPAAPKPTEVGDEPFHYA